MPYREAWDLQLQLHERVLTHQPGYTSGALMLVEHPPVVTIGRHPNAQQNLLATPKLLQLRNVEVIETDRGGDITFHGPGQLVAYPIIPLNHYNLNLHAYLRLLEEVIIQTLAHFQIPAERSHTACHRRLDQRPPKLRTPQMDSPKSAPSASNSAAGSPSTESP